MLSGMNVGPLGDIDVLLDKLMMYEAKQLTALKKQQVNEDKQSGNLNALKGMFEAFNKNVDGLRSAFETISFKATTSDATRTTVQVTSNLATQGTHTILTKYLAKAQVYQSQAFGSSTTPLSLSQDETLALTIGTKTVNVAVKTTDTLQQVRDKINNAAVANSLDARVSILSTNDGPGGAAQFRLVASSMHTGVENKVTISDPQNLFVFAEQTAAQDAEFTFDGKTVLRPQNTINDVLDGLTFTLLDANSTAPLESQITVSQTTDERSTSIKLAMNNLLTSYNMIIKAIDTSQASSTTQNETFKIIKMKLQNSMDKVFSVNQDVTQLSSVGIITSAAQENYLQETVEDERGNLVTKTVKYYVSGNLELDATKYSATNKTRFDEMIEDRFTEIKSLLFDKTNGIFTKAKSDIETDITSVAGAIGLQNTSFVEERRTISQKIVDETARLTRVRTEMKAKYSALNAALAKMIQTSEYLTKQFDSLSAANRR